MKKIKWGNVFKIITLISCVMAILFDGYSLISNFGGFTMYGLITHVLLWCVAAHMYDDLEEQMMGL